MRTIAMLLAATTALARLPAAGAEGAASPMELPALGRTVEAAYFGTHLHRLVRGRTDDGPPTTWPDAVGALRLWDARLRWADVAPRFGHWDFARMDAYVDAARSRGARIVHVLGSTPRWASARPDEPCPYGLGCNAEPRDLALWDDYVRTVARRYRGRIHAYELWNEPYFDDFARDRGHRSAFFSGTAATMVELARRAHAVLRQEDPAAQLLSPGFVGGPERLAMFLQRGGGRWIDGVAYHLYADDGDRGAMAMLRDVREVLRGHGLSHLPLVNTETGFVGAPDSQAGAASVLARTMIAAAFAGVQGFYQYAWDNGRSGMLDGDGRASLPNAAAFRRVREWLLDARLDGCRAGVGTLVACSAQRGRQRLVIYWRHHGSGPIRFDAGAGERPVLAQTLFDATAAPLRDPTSLDVGPVPVAAWFDTP